jgi:peptidyl-prolyl cis-trans isomerase C
MKFFVSLLFVCPAGLLLAQNPPPKNATPVPQPTVTMMADDLGSRPPVVPPDKVILTVGDLKITAKQFDQVIDTLVPENYRSVAHTTGRKQMADNLVRMIVLSQEAQKRKLDETPSYKTQVQFQNINILASMAFEQINKETKPPEADLHKYYDDHKNDYEQVHARHILIRMQGSPLPVKPGQKDLTDAEALAKAQDLRKKIQEGGDFAAFAIQESDDTGSGSKGGDLGTFHHGQMVPSFEQAAFALKPGELSEPVKTQFGYHLIKVEGKDVKSFEDAREEIAKQLQPQQTQKAIDTLKNGAAVVYDPDYFTVDKK